MIYFINEIVALKGVPTQVQNNSCMMCIFHWNECNASLREICDIRIYNHVYFYCFQNIFRI